MTIRIKRIWLKSSSNPDSTLGPERAIRIKIQAIRIKKINFDFHANDQRILERIFPKNEQIFGILEKISGPRVRNTSSLNLIDYFQNQTFYLG